MYTSKLQICIKILCSIVSNGAMKLNQLTHKVEMDKTNLNSIMGFLYDRGLVGKQNLDDGGTAYFVTKRGLSVLRVVGPLVKEAQRIQTRDFEAISTALSEAESTSEEKLVEKQKRWWKLSDLIKIEVVD